MVDPTTITKPLTETGRSFCATHAPPYPPTIAATSIINAATQNLPNHEKDDDSKGIETRR
jgi:hypothetical protein